ncbi:aminoacylase-1-like isoform X1 [Liolophura sinensis]|uniref:aminoacylase-1-like isoform X1 n=2 Tax=Liolophura sinensis TaxID=3198878 RepID=UPI00315963F8
MSGEDKAVTNFREYLRIKTVQPNPDYDGALAFLTKMAEELDLSYQIIQPSSGRRVFVLSWPGECPSLPSLLLNSHTDVVPVFMEHWKVDPFSADKMDNGDIYARGSQDMKCVGIQYIEAIRRLKNSGKRLLRTIHLSFVPDEEIGGYTGMPVFVKDERFKQLNVGFVLDEGLASPTDSYTVFYGERSSLWLRVKCPGKPGHGSRFIQDTAAEKMHKVITRLLELRAKEENKFMDCDSCLKLGDVTTVNLTKLEGGVQVNMVPNEFVAYFDIRLNPREDLVAFEEQLKSWFAEAGKDVTYEILEKGYCHQLTSTDKSDPWWNAFSSTLENMNQAYETEIFPAGTDSRFLREIGLPAIGFSPMNNTPILLHDHNEFLNEKVFLKGIKVYEQLITSLGNVPKF